MERNDIIILIFAPGFGLLLVGIVGIILSIGTQKFYSLAGFFSWFLVFIGLVIIGISGWMDFKSNKMEISNRNKEIYY